MIVVSHGHSRVYLLIIIIIIPVAVSLLRVVVVVGPPVVGSLFRGGGVPTLFRLLLRLLCLCG